MVQEVGGASGEEPDGVVEHPLVEAAHVGGECGEPGCFLGIVRERIGRHLVEERLDGLADLGDVVLVLLVGVGVVRREPGDLPHVLAFVLAEKQVGAVLVGGEAGGHRQRLEAVFGQFQLVDDLGPEEAEGVGEGGELEPGVQLFGDGGPADEVALLEDQRPQTGLGQVGTVDESVVATPHHDGVVTIGVAHTVTSAVLWGGS